MSNETAEPTPPRPRTETNWLLAAALLVVLVSGFVAYATRPYDLGRPSPVTLKAETVRALADFRRKAGSWPSDESAPGLTPPSTWASESPRPRLSLAQVSTAPEPGKRLPVERAEYALKLRGKTETVTARFDPNERPGTAGR